MMKRTLRNCVLDRFLFPFYFCFFLTFIVFQALFILLTAKKNFPKISILSLSEEQIFIDQSKTKNSLFDFFSDKRFNYNLNSNHYILVEYRKLFMPRSDIKVVFTRDLSSYYLINLFDRKSALQIQFAGIKSLFSGIRRKNPNAYFIRTLKQLYFLPLWDKVNLLHSQDTQIVTTNSMINTKHESLLVLQRKYSTSMLWYSTNDVPFRKRGYEPPSLIGLAFLNGMIDTHFVWNDYQLTNLKKRGLGNIHVVGSIVFRPKPPRSKGSFHSNRVIYFDITPQDLESSFYTTAMAVRNIDDISREVMETSLITGKQISLYLKQKRRYFHRHSKTYINHVEKIKAANQIVILDQFTNIYDEINNSDLVIAMPFSSPALIASEYGIPSIYYSGLSEGWDLGNEHYGCSVLTNPKALQNYLLSIFLN
jgi:hypothetical protein